MREPERSCASICIYCFDPALIKKQEDRVHALLQVKGYIIPLIVHALQLTSCVLCFFFLSSSLMYLGGLLLPHLWGEEILARTATVFQSPSSSVQHPVLTQVDALKGPTARVGSLQIWKINNLTHRVSVTELLRDLCTDYGARSLFSHTYTHTYIDYGLYDAGKP